MFLKVLKIKNSLASRLASDFDLLTLVSLRKKEKIMDNFRIKTYVLGGVSTDCYLVFLEGGKKAVIIDPADNAEYIMSKCRGFGVKPEAVLLTHAHFDHIMAADDIRKAYGCKIYVHMDDEAMLNDPSLNLSGTMGTEQISISADHLLRDGDVLHFLEREWKVIATPGHTAGSVCYYLPKEEVLFSGDTLFAESLGRTDLPSGSMSAIIHSIAEKILVLPDDIMVYPGHGDATTIAHEKQYNPVAAYVRKRGGQV